MSCYTVLKIARIATRQRLIFRKNITFRLCDVKTPAGQKEFHRLGYRAVPVVRVGEKVVQGFSIKQFEKLYKAKD